MSDVMREAGKKSWETRRKNERKEKRKWKNAQRISVIRGKRALTSTKVRLTELGWKYLEFKSKKGFPRTGIVDLVAVKLDRRDADRVNVMLFQVKGGKNNRVSDGEKVRLKDAVSKVKIACNCALKRDAQVRFDWKPTEEDFDLHCS